jgi:outer membrane protein TolC
MTAHYRVVTLLTALLLPASAAAQQSAPDSARAAAAGSMSSAAPAARPGARPLSLDEAMRLAAERSEAVGIAEAGVERARGEQRRARSEFFPQLTGTATYTRTLASQFEGLAADDSAGTDTAGPAAPASCDRFRRNTALPIEDRVDSLETSVECLSSFDPFAAFENLPFGRENQYSFGLQLSQTLFAGGRIRAQTRAAAAGRRGAEIELASQKAQLALDVTQAYYDAALSDRLLAIAEASLEQAERTLSDTRLARQVGTQPEFELLRATVSRDNLRPAVIQRRAQRNVAYLRLKQLADLPLGEEVVLTTGLGDSAQAPDPQPVVVPASLRESGAADTTPEARAAVRRANEGVVAAEAQLTAARAASFPALSLSSSYARIAFPGGVFSDWGDLVNDWTVSLSLRVPLFTGGRLSGERMIARAGVEEARLRLQQTRELAAIDAANAAAQLEAAEATWAASSGTVEQAGRAYSIAEIRYREGISTQTELSDSRLLLQQALANRAQAARDLQVARVRMALLRDLPLGAGIGGAAGGATAGASGLGGQGGAAPGAPQGGGAGGAGGAPGGATATTAVGGLR